MYVSLHSTYIHISFASIDAAETETKEPRSTGVIVVSQSGETKDVHRVLVTGAMEKGVAVLLVSVRVHAAAVGRLKIAPPPPSSGCTSTATPVKKTREQVLKPSPHTSHCAGIDIALLLQRAW